MVQNVSLKGLAISQRELGNISTHALTLHRFLGRRERLRRSDVIFVLGSNYPQVGHKACDLYHRGFAPKILFAGGVGRGSGGLTTSEAEWLQGIARSRGVPAKDILLDTQSTNTGENIRFGMQVLQEAGITPQRIILITIPPFQLRGGAEFKKNVPGIEIINSAMIFPPAKKDSPEFVKRLKLLVGEIDRLLKYPALGYIDKIDIPPEVISACEALNRFIDTHDL